MEDNSLANALLEHLGSLIDDPWDACLAGEADLQRTGAENCDRLPSSTFRRLAPAAVEAGGGAASSSPRSRRLAPAPSLPVPLREQDRLLPMANVARLMAIELPKDAKISRDAKMLMQEMVTEFICITTAEANDFCIAENHKAITQEDHLKAVEALGACVAQRAFPAALSTRPTES